MCVVGMLMTVMTRDYKNNDNDIYKYNIKNND